MSIKFAVATLALVLATLPGVAAAEDCGAAAIAEGRTLHTRGALDQVVAVYTKALETCDLSQAQAAHIYYRRGVVNFARSEYEDAAVDYGAALDRGAERTWFVLMARASAYLGSDANDKAVTDLTKAIGLEPGESALYLARMNANQRLGNDDAVQNDLDTIDAMGDKSAMWAAYKIVGIDPELPTQ